MRRLAAIQLQAVINGRFRQQRRAASAPLRSVSFREHWSVSQRLRMLPSRRPPIFNSSSLWRQRQGNRLNHCLLWQGLTQRSQVVTDLKDKWPV